MIQCYQLPAPLNLITTALYPMHHIYTWRARLYVNRGTTHSVSCAGKTRLKKLKKLKNKTKNKTQSWYRVIELQRYRGGRGDISILYSITIYWYSDAGCLVSCRVVHQTASQLWVSSITPFNITIIAHNQYTNIYPQTYIL